MKHYEYQESSQPHQGQCSLKFFDIEDYVNHCPLILRPFCHKVLAGIYFQPFINFIVKLNLILFAWYEHTSIFLLQETLARTRLTPVNAKHIKDNNLFVIHFAKMRKMVNVFTWGNPYNNFIWYITQSSILLCAIQKKQIPLMYFRWNPNVPLVLGSMGSSLVDLHLICFYVPCLNREIVDILGDCQKFRHCYKHLSEDSFLIGMHL